MPGKSKLNATVLTTITDAILDGCRLDAAAARAGIGARTLHDWLAKGKVALERADGDTAKISDDDTIYAATYQAVEEARLEWKALNIATIARGARGTHKDVVVEVQIRTKEEIVDGELKVVERTTTEKRGKAPDTADAKWLLERLDWREFGRVWRGDIERESEDDTGAERELDELVEECNTTADELAERRSRREEDAREAEANG